jgi:hypothetical protein
MDKQEEMDMEDFKVVVVIVLVILLAVGGSCSLGILLAKKSCLASYQNFQPEWGFFEGCRIVVDGKLTPVDIVRELK